VICPALRLAALLVLALSCLSCYRTENPTKVIVGAAVVNGTSVAIDKSVVVIRDGKIAALGTQQSTPVPVDSEKINGIGKYIVSTRRDATIATGAPADLQILSANPLQDPANYKRVERSMVGGNWVN
jgi:imidazolonepropionase-like amidohydrolase